MKQNRKPNISSNCIFCKDNFPQEYQLITDKPKYWTIVHNIKPACDFHCLIILKKEVLLDTGNPHINDIGTDKLSEEVFAELGILLSKMSLTIKKCSDNIKTVTITSLNSGMDSKHPHFHLIPILKNDNVKKVNSLVIDGGGFSFLARKEIVDDMLSDFIDATCGESSSQILDSINTAQRKRISENVELLKKFFIR